MNLGGGSSDYASYGSFTQPAWFPGCSGTAGGAAKLTSQGELQIGWLLQPIKQSVNWLSNLSLVSLDAGVINLFFGTTNSTLSAHEATEQVCLPESILAAELDFKTYLHFF